MKKLLLAALAALSVLAVAPTAGATTYTLYIHGRTSIAPVWGNWSYWGHVNTSNVVNPVPVNYDGTAHIANSNPTVVWYLNNYCTNGNNCYVVCHSAGCAQIGYAFSTYGDAWAVHWVASGGSAAGGSEIAGNVAAFFTGYAIDNDLSVGTMRGLYNHDRVGDYVWSYVYAHLGADWASLTNWLFSGNNDSAVSFHSSGHFRNAGSYGGASGSSTYGGTYWDWTQIQFVDPSSSCAGFWLFGSCIGGMSGNYGHCDVGSYPCEEGNYGGIMGYVANNFAGPNAH